MTLLIKNPELRRLFCKLVRDCYLTIIFIYRASFNLEAVKSGVFISTKATTGDAHNSLKTGNVEGTKALCHRDATSHRTSPRRQAQLRAASAFIAKSHAIDHYIADTDVRFIAISVGRFGLYVTVHPQLLILSALFPFGEEFVTVNRETGQIVDEGFHLSLDILGRVEPSLQRRFWTNGFRTYLALCGPDYASEIPTESRDQ